MSAHPKLTRHQLKAHAAKRAKAAARFRRARDLSEQGLAIHEAADVLGMTKDGVKSMLFREVGSSCWPIRQEG